MKAYLLTLVLCYFNVFGQVPADDHELEDMCIGTGMAFNEIWSTYPKTKIKIKNLTTGNFSDSYAVVMNDHQSSYYTVVALKINANLAVVFGYAPGINQKLFNNYGEFFMCERRDGDVKMVFHFYEPMKSFSSHNEMIYYIEKYGIQVYAQDRLEVRMFKFERIGLSYFLPEDYFEYK